jgi:hypoxanthine phosphoribosyltransferase
MRLKTIPSALTPAKHIMPELIPILNKDAIAQRVAEVARRISLDYSEADLVIVGVLKGAFVFLADLIRQLTLERFTIDFVRVASYGRDLETSGNITLSKDIETDINGKDLLIVEDILDSGLTLSHLITHFRRKNPKSIKICTLIDKRERRQVDLPADYICHTVTKGFLVGYGLDYAEAYRHLPGVFDLKL